MDTFLSSDIITVAEAAAICGVSTDTVKRWARGGSFPQPIAHSGRNRAHWRFRRAEVLAYVSGLGDVAEIVDELIRILHAIAHDPAETPRGQRWAAARLAELRNGDPAAMHALQRVRV